MAARKLIKTFALNDSERNRIDLSTSMTLTPRTQGARSCLRLRPDASGTIYPLTADLKTKTWLTYPESAQSWILFYADVKTPVGTSVGYRLSVDGVNELWWDGAAWSTPAPGDWNTEAEISANVPTLPFVRKIQVILNLVTTIASRTPEVYQVSFLYGNDNLDMFDYVRSLLILLGTVRCESRFEYASTGAATFTLDLETPYTVTAVTAAYDLTADPHRQTNLFQAYDSPSRLVTLSAAPPAGNVVNVAFEYAPVIADTTDQDYAELAKIPAITVEDINAGEKHKIAKHGLFDKVTSAGWALAEGYQVDLDFGLRIVTDKSADLYRAHQAVYKLFADNPFLVARGTDERNRLWLLGEFDGATYPTIQGLHQQRLRARVAKAVFYPRDAEPINGVTAFNVSGGNLVLSL